MRILRRMTTMMMMIVDYSLILPRVWVTFRLNRQVVSSRKEYVVVLFVADESRMQQHWLWRQIFLVLVVRGRVGTNSRLAGGQSRDQKEQGQPPVRGEGQGSSQEWILAIAVDHGEKRETDGLALLQQ
jgi:hypothetical protein